MCHRPRNRLTRLGSTAGTDSFLYNALGQRMRATLNGTTWRYVYFGDRVLEETNDAGSTLARYTLAGGSYFAPLLHLKRATGGSRFQPYDGIGS